LKYHTSSLGVVPSGIPDGTRRQLNGDDMKSSSKKAVGISKSGMGAAYDGKGLPQPQNNNRKSKPVSGGNAPKASGHKVGGGHSTGGY
jgi:hypothetical protein